MIPTQSDHSTIKGFYFEELARQQVCEGRGAVGRRELVANELHQVVRDIRGYIHSDPLNYRYRSPQQANLQVLDS